MTKRRAGKAMTRFLMLLILGLAASVFGMLAMDAYANESPALSAPVVRLLNVAPSLTGGVV